MVTLSEARANRREARLTGAKAYQGMACHNGHQGLRHTSDMRCVDCGSNQWRAKQEAKQRLEEARARGDRTFQGVPCKHGHSGIRYTSHKVACVECSKERELRRTPAQSRNNAKSAQRARERKQEQPAYELLKSSRQRAVRKGLEHTIRLADIVVPDVCPVFGTPLIPGAAWDERMSAPSLDRVNNSKGYVPGNVQVISLRANQVKNDSSIEELEAVLEYMKAHSEK